MSTAFLVDNILNDKNDNADLILSDCEESRDTTSSLDSKYSVSTYSPTNVKNNNNNTTLHDDNNNLSASSSPDVEEILNYSDQDMNDNFVVVDSDDNMTMICDLNTKETTLLKDTQISKPILKFSVSAILGDTKDGVKMRNEIIQPQHIWPYIHQSFMHHTQFSHPAFLSSNNNNCQQLTAPSSCNLINNSIDAGNTHVAESGNSLSDDNQQKRKQIIAKPLPSRPSPFIVHGLSHTNLNSLLAHCRNPYLNVGGPQVFPLAPGQGFPWAHSSRGKPRRGMMRRAVFSDSQRKGLERRFQQQKYISKPDRKKLAERLGLKDSQVASFHYRIFSNFMFTKTPYANKLNIYVYSLLGRLNY
ncbi:hybrid signal transduction histidine kinase L [Condylostylus longicornis]|uniref:hybrid signal transduction histidine kinase L n=1 Tax=Condylostylus longicornis TaxID=2530218 RepID=UPI00244D9967|nr:hybrid signal transduction histidine kinase L [Condylostylus longicornis]